MRRPTELLNARWRADVNLQDSQGSAALHAAAYLGHAAVVQRLLEKGANVDLADGDGDTALAWAVERGHDAIAALLQGQLFAPRVLRRVLDPMAIAEQILPMYNEVTPLHDNGAGHATIYLHAGHAEQRGVLHEDSPRARLLWQLIQRMRAEDPRESLTAGALAADLEVRCVELHEYQPGGALMNRDHRDSGSTLTLSLLLSDPASFEGGQFITWGTGGTRRAWADADVPTPHELGQGDAILFRSEDLHNVTPLTSGERRALVVEVRAHTHVLALCPLACIMRERLHHERARGSPGIAQ